ncbi:hypothetical protein C1C98_19925 [Pseudomonas ogarae]|uniref:DUF1534 domain-containing protein n=1 Tax=Pseudomonas ogarae (strain DSM 112162 / CECT 30235 / F113) TaxID=1114970 RepID=A0ABM6R3I0_PSEO1|nr:hypothetical protein C1C98_19925 [Pseudomonas ogarae]
MLATQAPRLLAITASSFIASKLCSHRFTVTSWLPRRLSYRHCSYRKACDSPAPACGLPNPGRSCGR